MTNSDSDAVRSLTIPLTKKASVSRFLLLDYLSRLSSQRLSSAWIFCLVLFSKTVIVGLCV